MKILRSCFRVWRPLLTQRGDAMKILFKLAVWTLVVIFGGVLFIRYPYDCSWKESFDIADEFVNDLLG